MVVRVEKPAFNLRDKLNELDYGTLPVEKMPSGSVVQYVLAPEEHVGLRYTTTSGTAAFTGIYIEIVPKFANSHIHIHGVMSNYHNSSGYCYNKLKNATSGEWVSDNGNDNAWTYASGNDTAWYANPVQWRDAPNSTEKQKYEIWGYSSGSLGYWGWSQSPASGTRNFNNLCAFEVKQ